MNDHAESPNPRLDGVRVLVLFGGEELFGQERANIEVFRNLTELGLKARFVTSSKWGWKEIEPELSRHGFEWTTAPFGYQWTRYMLGKHFGYFLINLYGIVGTSWRVWREVRRWQPTHLYVMNWIYFTYAAPAILMLRHPLIFRAGDTLPTQKGVHRWISRRLLRRLAVLVCNSHFIGRQLRSMLPPDVPLTVIHNHPPQRIMVADRPGVNVPAGSVVVVYVGQLTERKGVQLLVEAVISVIKSGRNVALLVAGESGLTVAFASRLQGWVREEKLNSRIQFLGYVENVPGLLRQGHVHACPSVWDDPSPNVIMEAKRENLPSVVFARGGIPELIEHQVDGYICKDCTSEALAEGLTYFIDNPFARRQAGVAARLSLEEKFGEQRFRRDWTNVFSSTAPHCPELDGE